MARNVAMRASVAAALSLTVLLGGGAAVAQDRSSVSGRASTGSTVKPEVPSYRGLTINREPDGDMFENPDPYADGPVHYNDVRHFSPAPYVTSGVQYPYGLDGVGGYGSDLGFAEGQDAALYNRGAGVRP